MEKKKGIKSLWAKISLAFTVPLVFIGGYFYFDKKPDMNPAIGIVVNGDSIIIAKADSLRKTGMDSLQADSIARLK